MGRYHNSLPPSVGAAKSRRDLHDTLSLQAADDLDARVRGATTLREAGQSILVSALGPSSPGASKQLQRQVEPLLSLFGWQDEHGDITHAVLLGSEVMAYLY